MTNNLKMKSFQNLNKNNQNIDSSNNDSNINVSNNDSNINVSNNDSNINVSNNDINENLYKEAIYAQNKGNLVKASKIFNILFKKNYRTEQLFLNYALVSQYLKDIKNAIILYKEAIKINSKNFILFFKMGFILNNIGRFYEAYPFAKKAIDLDPNNWQSYHNLIKILINLNKPTEAINIAIIAKYIFPNNHLFSDLLGEIYRRIGDFEKAIDNFKTSIFLAPNDDEAHYSFANFLIGIGNKKDSLKILNKILKKNPKHSMSYYLFSTIINVDKNQDMKNRIINLKIGNFKLNKNRFNILFSKSNIYHKLKEFKKSSEILKLANELKLLDKPSNIEEVIKLSETIKNKIHLDKSFNKPKFKYLRDIFIIGLPRSGSTLVESIIGMNKDVHNLGENSILRNAFVESEKFNYSNADEIYLKYSQNFSTKKYTTNKMLSNYMHIPHIISKLEHSKVIYTFRNPLDNILSLYRAKFTGSGNEYSSSLKDSAEYYMYQFKIMSFYREKYKNYIYFLSYDKLVNNPELEIRKMIDWLGLSWDDSYLYPDKSQQGFFTASNVQVRSPINNNSVGGWVKYTELMQEPITLFKKKNFKLTSFEDFI